MQLLAPRKRPGTGLGSRPHHPHRLESIRITEGPERGLWEDSLASRRSGIERLFGAMASVGGGLWGLPPWVRRLHRVRAWVNAKLALAAARFTIQERVVA